MSSKDTKRKSDNKPFSWLLKNSLITQKTGPVADLLSCINVEVLSETLKKAHQTIFQDPEMEKKKRKFRAEANKSAEKALAMIYELATIAALKFRQWQFVEHEPSSKDGTRTPDHLMLDLEGSKIIVEVGTLNLAEKVQEYEPRKKKLTAYITENLEKRNIPADVDVYCAYETLPKTPKEFERFLPGLISAVEKSRRYGRTHISHKLPNGDRIDIDIKEKVAATGIPYFDKQFQSIEDAIKDNDQTWGTFRLGIKKDNDFEKILGRRIAELVKKKDNQITGSGLPYPGVITISMGHDDVSVRQAVLAYKRELHRRKGPQELKATKAILFTSLFDPEMRKLIKKKSQTAAGAAKVELILKGLKEIAVASVHACWVPLAADFRVTPVGKMWNICNVDGLGNQNYGKDEKFVLPIFPKMINQ